MGRPIARRAMLRLSKLTDYATVLLCRLAVLKGLHTASALAAATGLAEPTVRKLMKSLAQADLVRSVRGANGGYELASVPSQISAAQIIDAIEGPVAITECSGDHSACDIQSHCAVGSKWQRISQSIHSALAEVSLAQLADPRPLPLKLDLVAADHTRPAT
jgi:FeS assembly SUF system regulator